jgi:hypothetical protein
MTRWDALFADLDRQWSSELRLELDAEIADRTRAERAGVGLAGRLAAARSARVEVVVRTGVRVPGSVLDVGKDWVLLGDHGRPPSLVPFGAITSIAGLGGRSTASGAGRRFGLGHALRGLSRDRAVVRLADVGGGAAVGTIDGVGADVVDLAEHAADLARRPENLTGRRLVPFAAIVVVRPA